MVGSAGPNGFHGTARAAGPGVVVGRSGASIGRVHFVDERFWPHNTGMFVTDFLGNHPRFAAYALSQLDLASFNSGSAQPSLNRNFLYTCPMRVPDLATQRRIAEILAAYDDLIEVNTRRIAILEEMARRIYEEWFVRYRFPGGDGTRPNNWFVEPLEHMIDKHIGGGWGKEEADEQHKLPGHVIRGTDIDDVAKGKISGVPFRFHKESNVRSRQLVEGDIVFEASGGSTDQDVGRALLIGGRILERFGESLICASFCKRISPKAEIVTPEFLYLRLIFSRETGELAQYQVQSTGIKNLGFGNYIAGVEVDLPPIELLEDFSQIARPWFEQIALLGVTNTNLRAQRDLLLPRLVSGEIDVSEAASPEKVAAE